MHDNKVSDKVIWEGNITPDEEISFSQYNTHSQPQMMFCYKCNNVIPGNSTFCPYCQVKLFTECPNCGEKYSSQYPACSKCGTNRQEYFALQQRERERKEAIEREKRRQREIEERKILEEERRKKEAEAIEAARRAAIEREERAKDNQARIEAAPIREAIIKKCNSSPTVKIIVLIWVILFLLLFVDPYFGGICIGWTIIGGIWLNIKIRIDMEKEIQEWRKNHPGDRRGKYLDN